MRNCKKGLLADCEHLLAPLTIDQEGHLKGGFATMSGSAMGKVTNNECKNTKCNNNNCTNHTCTNQPCTNGTCKNDRQASDLA